ncbi:MAG: hypothetical protein QOE53_1742, partial [Pseudonocardiales bacterium]|nr:hypothetical protein [Pseudonocardiales bacterium]
MTTSDRPGDGPAEEAAFESQQLPLGMPSEPAARSDAPVP